MISRRPKRSLPNYKPTNKRLSLLGAIDLSAFRKENQKKEDLEEKEVIHCTSSAKYDVQQQEEQKQSTGDAIEYSMKKQNPAFEKMESIPGPSFEDTQHQYFRKSHANIDEEFNESLQKMPQKRKTLRKTARKTTEKKTSKNTLKKTPSDELNETSSDSSKDTTKTSSKGSSKETSNYSLNDSSKETSKGTSKKTTKQTSKQTSKETSRKGQKETSKKTRSETSGQTLKDNAKDILEEKEAKVGDDVESVKQEQQAEASQATEAEIWDEAEGLKKSVQPSNESPKKKRSKRRGPPLNYKSKKKNKK